MTREIILHCLKSAIDEENCENCKIYGQTGEDHCFKDAVRAAIEILEQDPSYNSIKIELEPCEDAISREDALMALTGEWTESRDEILSLGIRRIKALPSVTPMQKWIPVSERLPVHNDVYLVALNMVGYPVRDIDGFVVQEQMWERYGKKVLAWMPLPEPYREDAE